VSGVSLSVSPGETVAVVGAYGSGKTTLVALLARFFDPSSGAVTPGGVDVRDLPVDQLRSMIAVVAQDTHLFTGTVRDNLLMADPSASPSAVASALDAAGASSFVADLPAGLDTVVGEGGSRLSGGQRQRLALARALLTSAPVLVLDEATASVDAVTEASIQAALEAGRADRTTLVIAHRLSTVRHADRIVVLDAGRVAQSGTHEELSASPNSPYARLIATNKTDSPAWSNRPARPRPRSAAVPFSRLRRGGRRARWRRPRRGRRGRRWWAGRRRRCG
jgi:ABC-type multidrug transport system fused ATPase/permease subunit